MALTDGLGIAISPHGLLRRGDQVLPQAIRLCLGDATDIDILTTAIRTLIGGPERGPTWASGTRV